MDAENTAQGTARRVADARERCIAAFATVAERLAGVHGGAMTLTAQASDLRALLESGEIAVDPLAPVRETVAALRDAILQARVKDVDAAPLTLASAALDDIGDEARRLSAVAALTLITAQSLGAAGLDEYVMGLRALNGTLAGDAGALEDGLHAVVNARQRAAGSIARATAALEQTTSELAAIADMATTGAASATLADVSRVEDTLRGATGRETRALIAAIQFSDAMAQRLDHVQTLLGMTSGRAEAVGALIAAQLSALAQDGADVCADADAALVRLESTAAVAQAALHAQTDDTGVAVLLRRRRDNIAVAIACEKALGPALAQAAAAADEIEDRMNEALERFSSLGRSAVSINLSAINATLLTTRSGTAKAPLGVLAEAVRDGARLCAVRSDTCRGALEAISARLDPAAFAAFDTALDRFRDAVATCSAQLDAAEAAERTLGRTRVTAAAAADDLATGVQQARQALAAIGPELEALAASGAPMARTAVDAAAVSDLKAVYTMDREREVHAALCNEAPVAAAAPVEMDALDSILF